MQRPAGGRDRLEVSAGGTQVATPVRSSAGQTVIGCDARSLWLVGLAGSGRRRSRWRSRSAGSRADRIHGLDVFVA